MITARRGAFAVRRLGAGLRLASCVATFIMMLSAAGKAGASPANTSLHDLAIRFRPYIKTTRDSGHGENIRPASWSWFLGKVSLVVGYKPTKDFNCEAGRLGTDDQWPDGSIVARPPKDSPGLIDSAYLSTNPAAILTPPGADVRPMGTPPVASINQGYALHLDDKSKSRQGEDWSTILSTGDGIYAHAEEVPDQNGGYTGLVNIEYMVLWPYNAGICSYHHGDITTMTVVYDRASDLVTRVSYSMHGVVFEAFQVAPAPQVRVVTLDGKDDDGNVQTVSAAQVLMLSLVEAGDSHFTAGDAYVYFVQDPETGRFEHPVAYAEYNSHELWPNATGKELTVASHKGDGFSFLTSKLLEDLGTVANPNTNDAPFLFFNGAWGTDPRPVMQHRTWFWPQGRGNNPYLIAKFTDPDPYTSDFTTFDTHYVNGTMTWPPSAAYDSLSGAVEYVDPTVSVDTWARFNDPTSPFRDVNAALSFLPNGGTLVLVGGLYPEPRILDRPCVLRAPKGVTFGR